MHITNYTEIQPRRLRQENWYEHYWHQSQKSHSYSKFLP